MRFWLALLCCGLAWSATSPVREPVWKGDGVTLLGAPSLDGRWLSFVDPATGDLALREVASGRVQRLTHSAPGSKQFAYFSTISPDARRVAYAWFNESGFYELRLVATGGAEPKVLFRNEEAGFVQPCAWSPDGAQILTLLFRKDNISQITLIPAAGGAPKVLKSLPWVYPKKMDLSPDGRYIVYDTFAPETAGDRTLFLLAVDGSQETRLITRPGNHLFPIWTRDGRSVVFASDAGGSMDAWALDIQAGVPKGEMHLAQAGLGRFVPLGITQDNTYFYGLRTGQTDVYISDLDLANARISERRLRASVRYPGRNSAPAWSPDGHWLAFLSRRGIENFGQDKHSIVLRSLDSTEERDLAPKVAHLEGPQWSPDGSHLVAAGSDKQGRPGLYRIDMQTAAVSPLVRDETAGFRGVEGAAAGGSLLYLHGASELREGDRVLYRALKERPLHHLAVSPDGSRVAVVEGARTLVCFVQGKLRTLELPFSTVAELTWAGPADALLAGNGSELWLVPLASEPRKMQAPPERTAGISVSPDGKRIAFVTGGASSEIWTLRLPR